MNTIITIFFIGFGIWFALFIFYLVFWLMMIVIGAIVYTVAAVFNKIKGEK